MNERIFGDITPIELTFVIIFAILIISTLNFSLSMFILAICGLIIAFISYLYKKFKKDKIKKSISKVLFIIVPILFLIDTYLTYYAVLNIKIANEANPFVLALWGVFGGIWGEVARFAVFITLITIIFYANKSSNEKRRVASSYLLLFMYFMWVIVVTSNIIQLIG